MKKALSVVLLLALAATTLAGYGVAPANGDTALRGTVKTGGSTSVERVMTALIYQFQGENQNVSVNYEMNGSGDGIKNTISGLYEIGHSSRELKTDGSEGGLTATVYAIDGIALVVNKANAATELTAEQVKGIYTGKIKNWSEVGGANALITVVTREASSGTRSAFAEIVGLEKANAPETAIVPNATTCDSTGAIQTTVSQNANAIGYMSFSDADNTKIKTLGYNGVVCSEAALKDGSYTLKREFYLVTKTGAELSPAAKAFMEFVTGSDGQKIVAGNKLLPIE
ncbi:phosphate ABC transporter substrate-binding protein [Synergistales bacterium]|nr:phosphate ABC transporter substrate-binding protein [Synergistales bacterium]